MLLELVLTHNGLGINLRAVLSQRGAYVDSFYRSSQDEPLEAERSRQIDVGDVLVSIGDRNVTEDTISTIQWLLRKAPRPATLIFQRSSSVAMTIEQAITCPFNRIWIKKFLRDNRVYLEDQAEWAIFCQLQDVLYCLDSFHQDTQAMSSLVAMTQPLVDSLDMTATIQSFGHNLSDVVQDCCRRLLHRGVQSIIAAFLSSDFRKRMEGYYFRYLSLASNKISFSLVLETPSTRLFVYLFLCRHRA